MYSPKIDEDLIPLLYKMAKAQSRPMTKIVNDIIGKAIAKDSSHTGKNKKWSPKQLKLRGKARTKVSSSSG